MKLFSAWYCPFAQRTWMALLYKRVPFEYVEIDPYQKTPEWMAISRGTGQVPVLVDGTGHHGKVCVPESIRTLEYIDMLLIDDRRPLFPRSAGARADVNFWIDFQGSRIIPYFYRLLKAQKSSESANDAARVLEENLGTLASHMAREGPYFSGAHVGAVDLALAPFALRLDILLSHYHDYALPTRGAAWPRYSRWWSAMRAFQPLVATSTGLPGYEGRLIDFYRPYSEGGGQDDVSIPK